MRTEPTKPVLLADAETPKDWKATIAGLVADRAQTNADLEAIGVERRKLALTAAGGDAAAMAEMGVLNQRQIEIYERQDLLSVAILTAKEQLTLARQAEVKSLSKTQRERLQEAVAQVMAVAAEFDAAAQMLTQVHGRFGAALEAMQRQGLNSTCCDKLRNGTLLTGALHLAGLASIVPLPAVSLSHRKTLADWTTAICSYVTAPQMAEPSDDVEEAT